MDRFAGRVVLVTGASSGIGAAVAREFARQGADLVLAARRLPRLVDLAAEVRATGRRALAVSCDVTEDGAVEEAVRQALEAFGRLDVAVANAGFGVVGPFERLTLDDYRRQFETNVFGVLRTTSAALPALRQSQGTLVIVGSVSAHVPTAGASAYAMSKAAVHAFAGSLRGEVLAAGVGVVLVSPGFVESEIPWGRQPGGTSSRRPGCRPALARRSGCPGRSRHRARRRPSPARSGRHGARQGDRVAGAAPALGPGGGSGAWGIPIPRRAHRASLGPGTEADPVTDCHAVVSDNFWQRRGSFRSCGAHLSRLQSDDARNDGTLDEAIPAGPSWHWPCYSLLPEPCNSTRFDRVEVR